MRLWLALLASLLPLMASAQAWRVEPAQWRVNEAAWAAASLPQHWLADGRPALHEWQIAIPPTKGKVMLYLPRFQAIGMRTVHAGERLVYRSPGDAALNGLNHPLCLRLDAGAEQPQLLRVQIDARAGSDVALSALWLGSPAVLEPMFKRRALLQTGLLD